MKNRTGFAAIRRAAGMSQQKFAEALGITKATVENIELRRGRISDEMAEAVGALTGAIPWTVSSDDPRDFRNRPYSAASFKQWGEHTYDFADIRRLTHMSTAYLIMLLESSLTKGGSPRSNIFRSVLIAFNRFLFTQIEAHGLKDPLVSLLQEHFGKVDSGKEMSVREAKILLGKTHGWKKHARRKWKRNTKVRYSVQSIPQFVPFVAFWKFRDGTPGFIDGMSTVRHIYDLEVEGERFRAVRDDSQIDMTILGDLPVPVVTPPSKRSSRSGKRV